MHPRDILDFCLDFYRLMKIVYFFSSCFKEEFISHYIQLDPLIDNLLGTRGLSTEIAIFEYWISDRPTGEFNSFYDSQIERKEGARIKKKSILRFDLIS